MTKFVFDHKILGTSDFHQVCRYIFFEWIVKLKYSVSRTHPCIPIFELLPYPGEGGGYLFLLQWVERMLKQSNVECLKVAGKNFRGNSSPPLDKG